MSGAQPTAWATVKCAACMYHLCLLYCMQPAMHLNLHRSWPLQLTGLSGLPTCLHLQRSQAQKALDMNPEPTPADTPPSCTCNVPRPNTH